MCILKEEESGQESGTSDHVWNILGIISSIASSYFHGHHSAASYA
jgi:hypothetical protein